MSGKARYARGDCIKMRERRRKEYEVIRKAWELDGFLQVEINWGENIVELIQLDNQRMEIDFSDARQLAQLLRQELGDPDQD